MAPGGRECVQPENLSMFQSWYHAAIFPTGEVVTTINKSGYIKIGCLTQFLLVNTVSWLGVGGRGDTSRSGAHSPGSFPTSAWVVRQTAARTALPAPYPPPPPSPRARPTSKGVK